MACDLRPKHRATAWGIIARQLQCGFTTRFHWSWLWLMTVTQQKKQNLKGTKPQWCETECDQLLSRMDFSKGYKPSLPWDYHVGSIPITTFLFALYLLAWISLSLLATSRFSLLWLSIFLVSPTLQSAGSSYLFWLPVSHLFAFSWGHLATQIRR